MIDRHIMRYFCDISLVEQEGLDGTAAVGAGRSRAPATPVLELARVDDFYTPSARRLEEEVGPRCAAAGLVRE